MRKKKRIHDVNGCIDDLNERVDDVNERVGGNDGACR